MKILFLTNIPAPYRVDFFSLLGERDKVTVLYERRNATDRDMRWIKDDKTSYQAVYLPTISVGNDKSIGLRHLRFLRKKQFDLIVFMGYSTPVQIIGIIYCIIYKLPYTIVIDGAIIKNDYKKLSGRIKRFLISHAEATLCTGTISKTFLENYGAKKETIYIVPFTSVHEEDILNNTLSAETRKELRNELGIEDKFTFISVGQFIHRKGFDLLLEATAHLGQDIQVIIIGGTPTEEYIDLCNQLRLSNVRFIDFQPKEQLKKYYLSADVFVMPTREDVWGLVINEALALGLPVISSDACVAAKELIGSDNGIIIPSNDVTSLIKVMYTFSKMDQRALSNYQNNNLQLSRRITIETMAEEYHRVLNEIVNKKKI